AVEHDARRSRPCRCRPRDALRARARGRALLRDGRADVRRCATGGDRPLRRLVPQHRDSHQPWQRGRDVRGAARPARAPPPGAAVTRGQRFARFVTDVVVRWPALWRVLRRPMRTQFDKLAPAWEGIRMPDTLAPVEAGLDRVTSPPDRALDLGTGTGGVARLGPGRFPEAEIVGGDLATQMIGEARRVTDSSRITYQVADAQKLPFADGA